MREKTRKLRTTLKGFPRICNAPLRGLLLLALYIFSVRFIVEWKTWFPLPILHRGLSIHTQRTVEQYSQSLVPISVSLRGIQGNRRDTAYKHDTRLKSSDCTSAFPPLSFYLSYFLFLGQNRQGCSGCKWFRCRREHVREESAATSRGVFVYTTILEIALMVYILYMLQLF